MLRIRLRRTGRKNRPNYRIVVAEHTAPLTGKFVEELGHFDPRTKAMGIDNDRLIHWLNVGAQPSNRVAKLLHAAKVDHKLIVVKQRTPRAPKNAPEAVEESAPAADTTDAEVAATQPEETVEADAEESPAEPTAEADAQAPEAAE